jgi:hypothetical protein
MTDWQYAVYLVMFFSTFIFIVTLNDKPEIGYLARIFAGILVGLGWPVLVGYYLLARLQNSD